MTAEHLLQHYQLHDALGRDMWPEPIPLRVKLYGNLVNFREGDRQLRLAYDDGEEEDSSLSPPPPPPSALLPPPPFFFFFLVGLFVLSFSKCGKPLLL